ncbi:MAG: leucine-rich repeat domain-containing protein [Oscillospiraceae bacterium]|nr:leucine-rich repeat domain-containing protein [Oscillospiraceae bacterium]
MKNPFLKYGLAVLLSGAMAVSATGFVCSAEADEDEQEYEVFTFGDYEYSRLENSLDTSEKAACIEKYTGSEKNLVLPSEIDGLEVVKLGEYAFVEAMYLETITIPKTVTDLGNFTFANCANLKEYIVEEGNPYFSAKDGVLYAEDGTALMRWPLATCPDHLVIPDEVTSIGDVAFTGSLNLQSVEMHNGVNYIGSAAFSDCSALTDVKLSSELTLIEPFTFNSCSSLKSIIIPNQVTSIGNGAFSATALETISIPSSVTSIGQQAFAATNIKEVVIPATVTDIGYSAFGWFVSPQNELYMDSDFIIHGVAGSAAEVYATDFDNENDFRFIPDAEEYEDTAEDSAEAETEEADNTEKQEKSMGTGRIVGIAVCGLLLIGILIAAVCSGKKKSSANEEIKAELMKTENTADAETETDEKKAEDAKDE